MQFLLNLIFHLLLIHGGVVTHESLLDMQQCMFYVSRMILAVGVPSESEVQSNKG